MNRLLGSGHLRECRGTGTVRGRGIRRQQDQRHRVVGLVEHGGLAEGLPQSVGPSQTGPVRCEPAGDIEEPLLARLISRDEVHLDAHGKADVDFDVGEAELLERLARGPARPCPRALRVPGNPHRLLQSQVCSAARREAVPCRIRAQRESRLRSRSIRFLAAIRRRWDRCRNRRSGVRVRAAATSRRARAHERVEHEIADGMCRAGSALGELDRERRRVIDAARALGRDVPDVERGGHELVGVDRALATAGRGVSRSGRPLARSNRLCSR